MQVTECLPLGHTCFAGVLTMAGTPGWQTFSQQVADLWSPLRGARPHWGKEWGHLSNIDTFIQQVRARRVGRSDGQAV